MGQGDIFSGVQTFAAVAEECSFRRAAARLGVSPAAVSKAVQRLEEELGVQLLLRTSRSVKLTGQGQRFYARCREAVQAIEVGRARASESRLDPRGEAHLTMPYILGPRLFVALPTLYATHKNLSVRISMTDRLLPLARHGVDLALRIGGSSPGSLVSKTLRQTRWVTVASPQYLARAGTPRTPAELEAHNCLHFVATNGKTREYSFVGARPALRGNLRIDQGEQLLHAARLGHGVAQVFDFMAHSAIKAGHLVELLADYSAPGPPIQALMLPERRRTPTVRALLSFVEFVVGWSLDRSLALSPAAKAGPA